MYMSDALALDSRAGDAFHKVSLKEGEKKEDGKQGNGGRRHNQGIVGTVLGIEHKEEAALSFCGKKTDKSGDP